MRLAHCHALTAHLFCRWVFGVGLVGLLLAGIRPVSAQPVAQGGPTPVPANGTPTPSPAGTPMPTATAIPGATPLSGAQAAITENIFHIISFPFETMTQAVVNMGNKITGQAYKDAQWIYSDTLGLLIFGDYGIAPSALGDSSSSTPLFAQIIQPHWNVMLTLALLLLPATLALTAVEVLRSGVTSVMGYADMKEALLGWFISAGVAAASFYLLGLAHRLSLSASQAILLADFGERVSGYRLALAFFNTAAVSALANLIPGAPIALLYIGLFALFLASSIIFGLALALAAYTALVYMLSAIAPLIIVIGVLRPMRWLHALWLKTITLVFLLPIADALLLKAAVSLVQSFYDPNGSGASLGSFLAGLFVTGGVLSVLIVINFKVGEMVFGALGEIHQQAWGATMGVVQLAATAIGLVAGGVGIAAGGAGLASAGAAGGAGPAGGAGMASAMPAGASSSVSAESAGAMGQSLASETNPTAGSVASAMGNNSGLAQRTANLLANRLSTESASSKVNAREEQSNDVSVAGAGHSASGDLETKAEGNDGPIESASSMTIQASPSVTPSGGLQEMLRRSHLAAGFGRALAMTGNPALRGMGAGLQMAGAAGEFAAAGLRDDRRAATPQGSDSPQSDSQLINSALHWSGKNLSSAPNDLFDPGRDNTALMAGALHQAFLSDPDNGRATHMGDVLNMVRASYGQWQAQGQPGGIATQRAYFEAVADPGNVSSPGRLTGAIVQWAEQNNVQLGDNWASAVKTVFDRSQPMSE